MSSLNSNSLAKRIGLPLAAECLVYKPIIVNIRPLARRATQKLVCE
jgi:hypothetical protein